MKLTLFNGSPRGRGSNTRILMDQFIRGFAEDGGGRCDIRYLNHTDELSSFVDAFGESSHVIIAFPLYADSMPAIVKLFFEALAPRCGNADNPALGFVIQSGFPESVHSRFVEKYVKKLAARLQCPYAGSVIRGGVEGIQVMPGFMTRRLFRSFYHLGKKFASIGAFDESITRELAKKEKLSRKDILMYRILIRTGLANYYWDSQLKDNNAFASRFAAPYEEE